MCWVCWVQNLSEKNVSAYVLVSLNSIKIFVGILTYPVQVGYALGNNLLTPLNHSFWYGIFRADNRSANTLLRVFFVHFSNYFFVKFAYYYPIVTSSKFSRCSTFLLCFRYLITDLEILEKLRKFKCLFLIVIVPVFQGQKGFEWAYTKLSSLSFSVENDYRKTDHKMRKTNTVKKSSK